MSGVDLGAELGISQQQISRYENATSEISVSTLINILAVFNITPAEFFTRISDTKHDFSANTPPGTGKYQPISPLIIVVMHQEDTSCFLPYINNNDNKNILFT